MRILHVVTLVTPDGRYGGPLRVALNQVAALRAAGHRVLLAAGAAGFGGPLPSTYAGLDLTLFPARQLLPGTGFAGVAAPGMLPWLRRAARGADVAHIHLARDLTSLPAAAAIAATGLPYVLQTHGMIDPSTSPLAAPLDAVATKRVLRGARTICSLTPIETEGLRAVEPGLTSVTLLHNGVPASELVADTDDTAPDVLFLARLAPRKHPADFVRAAHLLAAEFPTATFSLVGPDEGELAEVERLLALDDAGGRIRYEGSLPPEQTLARMSRAAIYVLPATDEPYGMTLLEAMSVGLPTVCLSDCGLADAVRATGGEVVEPGPESLASGITALLRDAGRRRRSAAVGRAYVSEHTSMAGIAGRLGEIYRQAVRS